MILEQKINDQWKTITTDGATLADLGEYREFNPNDQFRIAPSEANDWLKPGTECECGPEYRCSNHDTGAEADAFWRHYRPAQSADESDAYERNDPKRFVA